jgi:molecular chaperone DnaJ
MDKRDYYEILGVAKDADAPAIKRAYRKLAMELHPDRNPGDKEAEERFKEAAEAYEVLSDAEKRATYDRFGHEGMKRSGFGGRGAGGVEDIFSQFGDIFGDLFGFSGGGRGRQRRGGPSPGADLRYDLEIEFEEAVFGVRTAIDVPRSQKCGRCSGNGCEPGTSPKVCNTCKGQGQVYHNQGFFTIASACPHCRGRGKSIESPCKDCKGSGKTSETRKVTVRIPAGVDTGAKLRLRGEGDASVDGGEAGDLYVVVHVREHEIFKRDGANLYVQYPISFIQAALGAEITIPVLSDKEGEHEHKVTVDAGTQPNSQVVLRGMGVPRIDGGGRGDLVVLLELETPKKLSKKQRQLLEEFAQESGMEYAHRQGLFEKWFSKKKPKAT